MINQTPSSISTNGTQKLGPLWLMPGIGPINAISFFAVAMINNIIFSLVHYMQPYVFEVQLGIPSSEQGVLVGNLTVMQEFIVIAMTGIAGALADKYGRRPIFCGGTLLIGLAYALYPLAESVSLLYVARAFFGVGIAFASTVLLVFTGDYSQERSRGKWMGGLNFMQSIGALTASLVLTQVPGILQNQGVSPTDSVAAVFIIAVLVAVCGTVIAGFGLKPAPIQREKTKKKPLLTLLAEGFREAKKNPRITLAYTASMAARGDMVVVGAFTFLWLVRHTADLGLDIEDGYSRGRMIVPLITLTVLLSAPIMGSILDRVDRVVGIVIAFSISAVGYTFMGVIADPLGNTIFAAAVLLGLGEGACIMASIALIGQNAPPKTRGSVIGTFTAAGATGMLLASGVGGYLFDNWTYTGPFLFMGLVNAAVLFFAIYVKLAYPSKAETDNERLAL
jgi:MFS family permease